MATMDISSVREDVNNLKAQFEQLSAEGKMSRETKMLFSSLLLLVDLILSVFLERQTRKTASNAPACRHHKQVFHTDGADKARFRSPGLREADCCELGMCSASNPTKPVIGFFMVCLLHLAVDHAPGRSACG